MTAILRKPYRLLCIGLPQSISGIPLLSLNLDVYDVLSGGAEKR